MLTHYIKVIFNTKSDTIKCILVLIVIHNALVTKKCLNLALQ